MKNKMTYDVEECPPIGRWIILAIQHVFAMFGATVLVPILVNSAAGETVLTIPVTLVAAGIGTLIYILCTKAKSPVFLGSSFAYITAIAAAYAVGGISGAMTGIMAVGLVYIIVAIIIHFTGKDWLEKLLPPVVIGPMIMIIGLGLAPSAVGQIGLASETLEWKTILVAFTSFIVTALVMTRAKGFLKVIPFLIGIVSGYIMACCVGLVDFQPVLDAPWFSIPDFVIPFVDYKLSAAALITIVPIALVTLCEHIGDHESLSNIIGRNLIKDPGLDRTIMGDGVATFVAGAIGGPANTTYGENTAVVGMTRVASVKVIGLAAIIAIVMGFLGKFTALINTIPGAVLGGVSLLLYGFIAINGLKVLIKNQIDFDNSKNIVIASSMLVLGLGGAAVTIATKDLTLSISGMALASIVGIILNLVLPKDKEKELNLEAKSIIEDKNDAEILRMIIEEKKAELSKKESKTKDTKSKDKKGKK
jgi:uracil permease